MKKIGFCPLCGKLIAFIFPIHDCKPTPNFVASRSLSTNGDKLTPRRSKPKTKRKKTKR
jgi:hypothetical protein